MAVTEGADDLIKVFVAAARNHAHATGDGDFETANQEVDRINDVFDRLRGLGDQGREALVQVAESGGDAEAIMAAAYSLKYAPDRSLAVLRRLSKDKGILGFGAAQAIKRWKSGEWRLE